MEAHDFSRSLQLEHSGFDAQNGFYRTVLKAERISRADYGSSSGKKLQQSDIDVILKVGGKELKVSEKCRETDYGDLLLEFYSKFPDSPGWLDCSEADCLAYFVPGKVYLVDMVKLRRFYHDILKPAVPLSVFSRLVGMYPQGSARKDIRINAGGRPTEVTAVQAYNCMNDGSGQWYTESICIRFDVLRDFGVTVRTFDLQGGCPID